MNQDQKVMLNEILKVKNIEFVKNKFRAYRIEKPNYLKGVFSRVQEYMETLDESRISNYQLMLNELLIYFKENQPKLSKANFDRMLHEVLIDCAPKINNLARKLVNSVGDHEDYVIELQMGGIWIMRKYEDGFIRDNWKSWADWVYTTLRGIHNRYADLCKEFSKRADTSIFSPKFDSEMSNKLMYDAQDDDYDGFPQIESSEDTVVTNDLYRRLIEMLSREEDGEDIVKFLKESVNPSDETWKVYEEWRNSAAKHNPFKNSIKIPSKIICSAIGVEQNKIGHYKEVIGITLVKLGVDYGEVFPKYKTMNRNFWLSRGCPAPNIEYNADGTAKVAA